MVCLTQKFPENLEKPKIINNFNINNFYKINEFLGLPTNQPLWYIYQPLTKSSVGPISSLIVENMLEENVINIDTQVRLIDIYEHDNNHFTYFKLGYLNDFDNNNNNNKTGITDFFNRLKISKLVLDSLKGNRFYEIKFNLNKENQLQNLEMVKKFDREKKIECPIDLDNKHNLSNHFNKLSPLINKQIDITNNFLIHNSNNLFNKSNKIEKGINFNKNNNNNFLNSNLNPKKTEAKAQLVEIEKLTMIPSPSTQDKKIKLEDGTSSSINIKQNICEQITENNKNYKINVEEKVYSNEDKSNKSNNVIEVFLDKKYENYKENNSQDVYNSSYNHRNNYNNNYNNYQNKPFNRKYSRNKRGSLPPKKAGFNYNYYDFNEKKDYFGGKDYNNNYQYENNKFL